MNFTVSAAGPAEPGEVWEKYARPSLWSTWAPQIRSVRCADERIRVDTTGQVIGHFGIKVAFRVTAVDETARTWSWRVNAPLGVRLGLRHTVEAMDRGTSTSLTISGFAPVVLGYAPIATFALRKLVARPSEQHRQG